MTVRVYAPDLGDRTRIDAAVDGAEFVRAAADVAGADVAVLDLSRPGVLDVLDDIVSTCGRVVGFGSHVATEVLAAAAAAGVDAMPRSRFFRDVRGAVRQAGAP